MRRQRQQRSRGPRETNITQTATANQSTSARILISHGVDLNTNLGEGFGHYKIEGESDILPFVTSANIACGAHAGDPVVIESALEEVKYYGLALGAHIGYPDLAGFGRREIHLSPTELRAQILFQLGALSGLAGTFGFEFTQVRPHGFMYRQMAHDVRIATVIAKAIAEYDRWLVLIGPACSNLFLAGERAGVRVAGEALVDRVYDAGGNLLPHSHSRAVLKNPQDILNQASNLIHHSEVISVEGSRVRLDFQTIHLHPNMAQAKNICEQIRCMVTNPRPLTAEPFPLDRSEPNEIAFGV